MSNFNKPFENAVATKFGWAHPVTGELLVARRDLPNPVDNYKPNRPFVKQENTAQEVTPEVIPEVNPEVVETVVEQPTQVVEPEIIKESEKPKTKHVRKPKAKTVDETNN